jgi:hypothetical protein
VTESNFIGRYRVEGCIGRGGMGEVCADLPGVIPRPIYLLARNRCRAWLPSPR